MELSVTDLSKYLGVAQNTIERWIRQGKLPVSKKGLHYGFQSKELKEWAARHNITLNSKMAGVPGKDTASDVTLSNAIRNGGIYFDIQGNDVQSILKSSIERIGAIPAEFKPDLLDRLVQREKALSTGIGNGIAIPHPREHLTFLEGPVVSVCFPASPVEYHSLDRQPVFILFFLLCPSLKLHLNLLSVLSFCLRDRQFTDFLKTRPDPDLLIEKIEVLQKDNPL